MPSENWQSKQSNGTRKEQITTTGISISPLRSARFVICIIYRMLSICAKESGSCFVWKRLRRELAQIRLHAYPGPEGLTVRKS